MSGAGTAGKSMLLRAVGWLSIALMPLTTFASDHDFGAVVGSIAHTYHLHARHMPLAGMMSFCAHVATGGAVKGIMIAEFDESASLPRETHGPAADLTSVVKDALGASWSLIVASRSRGAGTRGDGRDREQTAIYARPHGERMTLLVASYDDGAMSVVRLDMNAAQFAKWLEQPGQHLHPGVTD